MTTQERSIPINGVSLVNGDSTVRHARQIILRSENFDVRAYATSSALLADPRSRDYPCIVVDVEMSPKGHVGGLGLLRRMRASGWRGQAIFLDGADPHGALAREAKRNGDQVFDRRIGDRSLVAAIATSIELVRTSQP